MKKSLKLILFCVILVAIIIVLYFLIDIPINFNQQSELKKVYSSNYTELEAVFLNISYKEIGTLDYDKLKDFLDLLKNKKIKKVKFYEYDKVSTGDSYRILLKLNKENIRIIISNNTITVNNKKYWVDNETIDLIRNIFKEYSEYYF